MKRNIINNKIYNILIPLILVFLFLPATVKGAKKKFFADLSVNLFSHSDTEFKKVYKSSITVPEIAIGYFFSGNFYIFGGFEFFSVDGSTPELNFDLKMDQKTFSLGGGYYKEFSEKLGLSGELGLAFISYTEESKDLELKSKSSCTGFRLRGKLQYKISDLIGLYIKLGYTIAKDTIDDISKKFGGLSTGLGIKFSF